MAPILLEPTGYLKGLSLMSEILEQNGITHYEEPCPYWEFDQTKEVTDTLAIDVTGGGRSQPDKTPREGVAGGGPGANHQRPGR